MSQETPAQPGAQPGPASASGHVVRGTLYLMAARIATLVSGLLAMAVLARLLTPAEFGAMTVAFIVINLPTVVYEGAFGLLLVQRPQIDDEFVRRTLWSALALGVAAMLALIAAAPLIEGFFDFPGLAAVLVGVSVIMPLKAASSISLGLLRRDNRFLAVATTFFFAGGVGNLLVAVPLALLGWGVWSLAVGAIVAFALETLSGFLFARYPLKPPKRWKDETGADRLSFMFTLTQVLNYGALITPNFIIGKFLGAAPLGLYSRASRIVDIAMDGAANPLQQTLIPAFSRMQHDLARTRDAFERALTLALLLFALLSALAIVEADPAVRVLLGEQWLSIVLPLQLLFAAFAPRAAYRLCESVAFGQGRGGRTALLQALFFVLMIAGAGIGLFWGVTGVAAGVAIGLTLHYLTALVAAARLVGSSPVRLLEAHARAVAVFMLVAGVGWLTRDAAEPLGFWVSYVTAGFAMLAMAVALLSIPGDFMGGDLVWARERLRTVLQRFRLKRSAP